MGAEGRPIPGPDVTSWVEHTPATRRGLFKREVPTTKDIAHINIESNYESRIIWLKKFIPTRRGLEESFSREATQSFDSGELINSVIFARKTLDIPDLSGKFTGEIGETSYEVVKALGWEAETAREQLDFYVTDKAKKAAFSLSDETITSMQHILDEVAPLITVDEWSYFI